jgi:hypothetical protein
MSIEAMKNIHPKLAERLTKLKDKYKRVTEFAELLPIFEERIIEYEFTKDQHCVLSSHYKDLDFGWNVNWITQVPFNFPEYEECHRGLICIYINCIVLFHEDVYDLAYRELETVMKEVPCYFVDHLNSTFYFKPEEIEDGLEALHTWYLKVKSEGATYIKEKKRRALMQQLEELKND